MENARRLSIVNQQVAPILKLALELILEIGRHVLRPRAEDGIARCEGKKWFAKVLPMLHTCTRLQHDLHKIRFERLTLVTRISCPADITKRLDKWYRSGTHRGPLTLFFEYWNEDSESLSTAAARAGALECHLYGRLHDPPMVYFSAHRKDSASTDQCVFLGWSREKGMRKRRSGTERGSGGRARFIDYPHMVCMSDQDVKAVWDEARARGEGVRSPMTAWAKRLG